jgi:hypothetical protein
METAKRTPLWAWVITGLIASIGGIASALAVTGGSLGSSRLVNGKWSSDPTIGSTAANPWLRARIARVGLLALSKEETLYFDRTVDEAGNSLRENCRYQISGGPLPTHWWSITIYDADDYLPRNTDNAGSIDATRALASGMTSWQGVIAPTNQGGNDLWLSSEAAGTFSLTLRLYQPASTQADALTKMVFPKVTLIDCSAALESKVQK